MSSWSLPAAYNEVSSQVLEDQSLASQLQEPTTQSMHAVLAMYTQLGQSSVMKFLQWCLT